MFVHDISALQGTKQFQWLILLLLCLIQMVWSEFDHERRGFIGVHRICDLLKALAAPLGHTSPPAQWLRPVRFEAWSVRQRRGLPFNDMLLALLHHRMGPQVSMAHCKMLSLSSAEISHLPSPIKQAHVPSSALGMLRSDACANAFSRRWGNGCAIFVNSMHALLR